MQNKSREWEPTKEQVEAVRQLAKKYAPWANQEEIEKVGMTAANIANACHQLKIFMVQRMEVDDETAKKMITSALALTLDTLDNPLFADMDF